MDFQTLLGRCSKDKSSVCFAQKWLAGISLTRILFTFILRVHFKACAFFFYLREVVESILLLVTSAIFSIFISYLCFYAYASSRANPVLIFVQPIARTRLNTKACCSNKRGHIVGCLMSLILMTFNSALNVYGDYN